MGRNIDGPEPSDSPELAEYLEEAKTSVNQWAVRWTLILKAHKIDAVHVVYGAGEDDGGIESITYQRRARNGKLVEIEDPGLAKIKHGDPVVYQWEEDQLEGFMYQLMQHRGFFNQNEGCQGIIRWEIDRDVLIHDHQFNVYGDTGEIANPEDPEEDQYRETTYIPQEVETYYGVDDLVASVDPEADAEA